MIRRRILPAVGSVAIALALTIFSTFADTASAQQRASVGGNALKVSPVRMEVEGEPGATKVIELSVQNLTNVQAFLHPAINDFVAAANETGQPNLILDEDQFAPTHSLKRFVKPMSDFAVKPGETKTVKVSITVPQGTAGGGYYGAVRFSPANSSGDKNVNLSASVASLVLLRVKGNITEEVKMASFDARKDGKPATFFTTNKDIRGVARFENVGNVQSAPFGTVILKRFGKTVGTYKVNDVQPRGNVLPDSVRRYEVKLDKVASFGKFTIDGNFGYGAEGQLISAKATFYVVPMMFMLLGIGLLLLLLFLVVGLPRMIRNYNRRIVRKATGRRR